MLKIQTDTQDFTKLDNQQNEWVYNSLDCCVTSEVWENIQSTVQGFTRPTYDFVRGMQGPALAMATRGILVDIPKRNKWIAEFEHRISKLESNLNKLTQAAADIDLNANSPDQLKKFFYEIMHLPPQYKYDKVKKERVVATNREALEKLHAHFYARPFINNILRTKDLKKKVGTLRTGVDKDDRMRTSYNVCGTETGRWSSNSNAFGTGTNLQNITDELREIFIADPGYKMGYFDGEQAESRVVGGVAGGITGSFKYLDACESGDLHTTVCQMAWTDLKWSKDPKENREIAEQKAYLHLSYRDLAKKLGHGSNYFGKPPTMASHSKLPVKVVDEFQKRYFAAFPEIPAWHMWTAQELQTKGYLVTPLGRVRYFLGRLRDDATLREAIAFVPQSTIGEIVNEAMYRVWWDFDRKPEPYPMEGEFITASIDKPGMWLRGQLLAQIHDAILFQFPDLGDEYEAALISAVCRKMEVPIPIGNRELIIPANCEGTGWNWRKYKKEKDGTITNPQGLKKFNGKETRTREIQNTSLLNRFYL